MTHCGSDTQFSCMQSILPTTDMTENTDSTTMNKSKSETNTNHDENEQKSAVTTMTGEEVSLAVEAIRRVRERTAEVRGDNQPAEIFPFVLYLGSLAAANNVAYLQQKKVNKILGCLNNDRNLNRDGFEALYCAFPDNTEACLFDFFEKCFTFLDSCYAIEPENVSTNAVLVHCYQGRSRSVSVLVGYLMYVCGVTYDKAFYFVRRCRPEASPNGSFTRQLRIFESELVRAGLARRDVVMPHELPFRSKKEHEDRQIVLSQVILRSNQKWKADPYNQIGMSRIAGVKQAVKQQQQQQQQQPLHQLAENASLNDSKQTCGE